MSLRIKGSIHINKLTKEQLCLIGNMCMDAYNGKINNSFFNKNSQWANYDGKQIRFYLGVECDDNTGYIRTDEAYYDVYHQVNWLLESIKNKYQHATFSGELEVYYENLEEFIVADDNRAYRYKVVIAKGDRIEDNF